MKKKKDEEPSDDHKRRVRMVHQVLDAVIAGRLAANGFGDYTLTLKFHEGEISLVEWKDHGTYK